jgi:glycosyltransferase involved in cell wall biosynthesis
VSPLLGPTGAGTHLVIAGDGPLLPSLRELTASLGSAPFVHLLGVRRDVPDVLNALDVFAMSSTIEGLPLVVLEAMATALPVVSTRIGGIPDVLEEGATGFLVPVGDEQALRDRVARLVAAPDLSRLCGERARAAAVTKFSAERMQRDYLELYARVLSRDP